ncbi:MAG TPA: MBL fold metallo-hydrolase [Saprospiraceae bacterium]|nr:MBL fold metallo-hydrolase [Saprospiraceae bacterium]
MRIHTLDLGFMGHQQAIAAFAVEGPDGLALVETGPASTLPALEAALAQHGWSLADFPHVFLSHIHFDHAGAAWALAAQGATIYVHPKGLPHLAAPEKLYNSARMIYGDEMERLWGPMHPIAEERLYAPAHGEVIEAAGLQFTAWHTPGHAVHHIAWALASHSAPGGGEVFTGDVAGVRIGKGPVVPPCPPPDIHVEDWLNSIRLLRELPAEHLRLTHFGLVTDKHSHLNALENRLLSAAEWMRPYAEARTPVEEVVPPFQAFVLAELAQAGVDEEGLQRYDAANPAFMSVAGLMRYWQKVRGV